MKRLPGIVCLFGVVGIAAAPQESFEAYERSVTMVREELSRHAGSADLSLVLAQVHTRASRFGDALRVYKEGREAHPNDLRFVTGLGRTYLAREELERAIESLERSLADAPPGSPTRDVRLPLAEAYTRKGEFSSAIDQLRVAAREGAPSPEILFELARALDTESRRLRSQDDSAAARSLAAEARETLEEAVRLRPGYAEAHYALGRLHARLGERELAKRRLDDFRRLQRDKGGVNERTLAFAGASLEAGTAVDLAKALSTLGETDRALDYTRRALDVLPRFEPAMVVRATILLRAQRAQEAKRAFDEVLSAYPSHPTALMSLAEIAIAHQNYGKATTCLLRAGRSGRVAEAWEVLYRLAADGLALRDRAEEFARAALRERPSAENYSNLAVTLFEAGRHAECEKVLRAGLTRYPGHQDLLVGLRVLEDARKGKR